MWTKKQKVAACQSWTLKCDESTNLFLKAGMRSLGREEAGVHLHVQSSGALSRRLVLSSRPGPEGCPGLCICFPAVSTGRLRPLPGVSSRALTAAQSRLSPQSHFTARRRSCLWTQHLSLRRTPSADRAGHWSASLRLAEIPELVQTPQPGTLGIRPCPHPAPNC